MFLLGSFINGLLIMIAGILGMFFRCFIRADLALTMEKAMGLAVVAIALKGIIGPFDTIVMILSLALGVYLGEMIDLEAKMARLADILADRLHDERIARGFKESVLIFCVGGMAVVGAVDGALLNNHDILILKGVIDAVLALVMTTVYGRGVILSAAAVFLYEGIIAAIVYFGISGIDPAVIDAIDAVGSLVLLTVGFNLLHIGKFKSMNYVPAIFVAIILTIILP